MGQVERNLTENGKISKNWPGGKKFDGKWENWPGGKKFDGKWENGPGGKKFDGKLGKFAKMGQVERNLTENRKIGGNGSGGKKFDGKWEN